jgi:hypothetical protein
MLTFVIACSYIKKKSEKRNENKQKKTIFGESEDGGAFTILGFIFSKQIQFKTHKYRVVENSMGYPNIYLLLSIR